MGSTLFKTKGNLYSVEARDVFLSKTKLVTVECVDNAIIAIMNYSDNHKTASVDFLDADGEIDFQEFYNYFDIDLDSKDWLESFGRWCVELSDI